VGLLPRLVGVAWAYLGGCFLIVYMGGILGLPEWTRNLAPFTAVARYPAEAFDPVPFAVLLGIFAALTAVGLVVYRDRDLRAN